MRKKTVKHKSTGLELVDRERTHYAVEKNHVSPFSDMAQKTMLKLSYLLKQRSVYPFSQCINS